MLISLIQYAIYPTISMLNVERGWRRFRLTLLSHKRYGVMTLQSKWLSTFSASHRLSTLGIFIVIATYYCIDTIHWSIYWFPPARHKSHCAFDLFWILLPHTPSIRCSSSIHFNMSGVFMVQWLAYIAVSSRSSCTFNFSFGQILLENVLTLLFPCNGLYSTTAILQVWLRH